MGTAAHRIQAEKALSQWRENPDFVGLHELDALNRLSTHERTKSTALWSEVIAILNRARVAI